MLLCWMLLAFAWAERLAVLDFTTSEEGEIVEILADQARAAALDVLDPETYSIITRENMMQILTDMGKDAACISGACEVELAQNIGADFVVSGSLHQVDGLYLVTLKLHETESGKLLSMENAKAQDRVSLIEETLAGATRLLNKGFYIGSESVWLTVSTKPSARLYLDDSLLCEQTPCRREVLIGQYEMRLENDVHTSVIEQLELQQDTDIFRQLEQEKSFLRVVGVAEGINLGLSKRMGEQYKEVKWLRTPIFEEIDTGQYQLTVVDQCYGGDPASFTLKTGDTKDVFVSVKPKQTTLKVIAHSPNGKSVDAKVYLHGEYIGKTGKKLKIPLCPGKVKVTNEKLRWEGTFSLKEDTLNLQEVDLYPIQSDDSIYSMVELSSGQFWMGSTRSEVGRNRDENQHLVSLSQDFSIGITEVNQGLWTSITGTNPSQNNSCGNNCPVDNVSWCDAIFFANVLSQKRDLDPVYIVPLGFGFNLSAKACNKLAPMVYAGFDANGYRLPTEAEWEYAAKAIPHNVKKSGNDRTVVDSKEAYSNSNVPGDVAWYIENSRNRIHPSCEKQRNDLGMCDVSGNVFEWTWDWYEPDTSSFPNTDPIGPSIGQTKVLRGGSYKSNENVLRNSFRYDAEPGYRTSQMGLRLVRTVVD